MLLILLLSSAMFFIAPPARAVTAADCPTLQNELLAQRTEEWAQENETMGKARFRLTQAEEDQLRKENRIPPRVPLHLFQRLYNEAAMKLDFQVRERLSDAIGQAEYLKTGQSRTQLAKALTDYLIHVGTPAVVRDGKVILLPAADAKRLKMRPGTSALSLLAENLDGRRYEVGFDMNHFSGTIKAEARIKDKNHKGTIFLPFEESNGIDHVSQATTGHELVHLKAFLDVESKALAGFDPKTRKYIVPRIRIDNEAEDTHQSSAENSFSADEANAWVHESVADAQTAQRYAGYYYELANDTGSTLLEAARLQLQRDESKSYQGWSRTQLMDYLKSKSMGLLNTRLQETQRGFVKAFLSQINAALDSAEKTAFKQGLRQSNPQRLLSHVGGADLRFNLENGTILLLRCVQISGNCPKMTEPELRRFLAYAREYYAQNEAVLESATQSQTATKVWWKGVSSADSSISEMPPGYKPRLWSRARKYGTDSQ